MHRSALILVIVLLLAACDIEPAPTNDEPLPTPTLTPTPIPTLAAEASIELVNTSDGIVCHAYIAPWFEPEWGSDLLPGTIPTDDAEVLTLNAGMYDGLVEFCDGEQATIYGLILDGPGEVWRIGVDDVANYDDIPLGKVQATTLTLVNDSTSALCQFYLVAGGEPGWDRPRFFRDEDRIAPGESRTFTVAPGRYNLRADACDAAYGAGAQPTGIWEERDITIQGATEWVVTP